MKFRDTLLSVIHQHLLAAVGWNRDVSDDMKQRGQLANGPIRPAVLVMFPSTKYLSRELSTGQVDRRSSRWRRVENSRNLFLSAGNFIHL